MEAAASANITIAVTGVTTLQVNVPRVGALCLISKVYQLALQALPENKQLQVTERCLCYAASMAVCVWPMGKNQGRWSRT